MPNIRVLYDLASLGMAQLSTHRTGTVRATEELARALNSTPGCDLLPVSSDFQGAAFDYCRQWIPELALRHYPWQIALSRRLYRHLYRVRFMHDDPARFATAVRMTQLAVKATLAPFRPILRRVDAATFDRADVYHAPSGSVPAQYEKRRTRPLPIFVTVHDIIPLKHPEYFSPALAPKWAKLRASFTKDRWYACSSESTRADLLETGLCDPERVFFTPLAAGAEFAPRPPGGVSLRAKYGLGDAPYLLSVCTLEPRKNLDTVIRTFLRLVREGNRLAPDIKLVLVGASGWLYQKISEAYSAAGDAQSRIVFTGHVPEEDLPALYGEAFAFVYLSLYEGFGLPVLEAMQCGLPVLTSNVSSLPEVVGNAGILQDPLDEDSLAHHLQSLCEDPALRADLSRRALIQAATFSWERCAQATLAAYRIALDSPG